MEFFIIFLPGLKPGGYGNTGKGSLADYFGFILEGATIYPWVARFLYFFNVFIKFFILINSNLIASFQVC